MIELDPDSLRRRAIDTRRRAREAIGAELRRQFLEIAEAFDDLADAAQGFGYDADVATNADGLVNVQHQPS